MAQANGRRTGRNVTDGRAVADRLEDRRLMSLTVSVQTTGGATSAVVTAGQVLTLDVIATVTGADGTAAHDALQDVEGSFLSTGVGASAVAGNLAVTGATAPFNALGSAPGTAADLNGDGHLDVGSVDRTSSGVGDYFFARAGGLRTDGVVSGATLSFAIATVSYTVTAVNGGGQTNIAFAPRDTSGLPGTVAALWSEGAGGTSNDKAGTFRAGSPFRVFASASQAATTGTVTASVYRDADGSGTRNGTEAGIAAATVYVDVGRTGTFVAGDPSGQTDAGGTATIAGVPAGTFSVLEVPPTGYAQSQPASGNGYAVTVTAGGTATAGPFGVEPDGSVGGSAYLDANGNGRDDGESPAAGAVVYLDVNGNGIPDAGDVTTTTAGDGTFTLANVPPGTYALRAVPPAGQAVTQPAAGGYSVGVAPGAAVTGQAFGFGSGGTVTGTVFGDANGDGVQGGGEAGLAGVSVYLDVNGNGMDDAGDIKTVTDATGAFSLSTATPGTYTVRDVVPAGDTQSVPTAGGYPVSLAAGTMLTVGPFGVVPPATVTPTPPTTLTAIGGTATVDTNGDGVGDTPRAGATLYLDANGNGKVDAGEVTATAAADGAYAFPNLAAGTYTVRQVLPLGYTTAAPAAGGYTLTMTAGNPAGGIDFVALPLPASPLTVAAISPPTTSVIAGTTTSVRVRVTNGGPTAFAGPVTVDLYLSATGTVTTQDAAVTTVTKALRLKPNKSAVVAVRYTYPASLATGTYQLVAAVSDGSTTTAPAVAAAGAVVVSAATVDLSPSIVAAAAGVAVRPGKAGAVSVRIANGGNVTAVGTVTVTIYATTTGAVDATAVSVGSATGRKVKVAARKSAAVKVTFATPASLAAGTYQLIAVLSAATTPVDTGTTDTSAAVATR